MSALDFSSAASRARPRHRMFAGAVVLATGLFVSACIIADPPADVLKLPPHRPTILHGSVVPSTTRIITTWPKVFIVPVEVLDEASFEWSAYIDFDPNLRQAAANNGSAVVPNEEDLRQGAHRVDIELPEPDHLQCHVVEILVARSFNTLSRHIPDSPGGDTVVWFYNPKGDGGCPGFEFTPDASSSDAAGDSGGTE